MAWPVADARVSWTLYSNIGNEGSHRFALAFEEGRGRHSCVSQPGLCSKSALNISDP